MLARERQSRQMRLTAGAIFLLLLVGCAGPSLVREMSNRGASYLQTGKVAIRGSEADVGSQITVEAKEGFIIQRIWDTIYASRPYTAWAASGFREVEFYRWEEDLEPVAVLLVNVTDEAHFKGQTPKDGFRCPGLSDYLMTLLVAEAKKRTGEKGNRQQPLAPDRAKPPAR
jgi:hypothetical protein